MNRVNSLESTLHQFPTSSVELAHWRTFFEDLGATVWLWDLQSDVIEFSAAWLIQMGYTQQQIATGKDWLRLLHSDDQRRVFSDIESFKRGESQRIDDRIRLRRADGNYQTVQSRAKVIELSDSPNHQFLIGLFTDVSGSDETDNAVTKNQRRWVQALEGSNVGVWDWNLVTNEVYFSPEWKRMLRFFDDDLAPTIETWRRVAFAEDLAKSDEAIQRYLAGETDEYRCECRVQCKDGMTKWILDRGVITERDLNGKPLRMVGTHDDITASKQHEQAIMDSARRIEMLADLVPGFFYEYRLWPDGRTTFPYASAGIEKIYGITPDEASVDASNIHRLIHPDDSGRVIRSIQMSADSGEPWDEEYRLVKPDNTVCWVRGVANRIADRDHDGAFAWFGYINDITPLKQREELLNASREQLRVTTSQVPGVVFQNKRWSDGRSCFSFASEGINDLLGLEPADLAESLAPLWELVHPDDREICRKAVSQSDVQKTDQNFEYRIILPSGKTRWLRNIATASPKAESDGATIWYGFLHDITELKVRETELRKNRDRLNQLASTIPGGACQYDLDAHGNATVPYAGHGVSEIFGVTLDEIYQDALAMWRNIHPQDVAGLSAALSNSVANGAPLDHEYRVIYADGRERWIRVTANCIKKSNGTASFFCYIMDVSADKQMDIALRKHAHAIEVANQDLEQFNRVAAHDLKEPLRAINHLCEWIEEDIPENSTESIFNNIRRMRERVTRLQLLIDDLAAYSRAGRKDVPVDCLNLENFLRDLISDLDPQGCRIQGPENANLEIITAKVALETILKNLIINAVAHYDREIDGEIKLNITETAESLIFSVEDNGPGIAPEHHDRIFRMYQRLNPESNPTGTGSGLAIVKRIISNVDSEISIQSPIHENRGSRFSFEWPRVWPENL